MPGASPTAISRETRAPRERESSHHYQDSVVEFWCKSTIPKRIDLNYSNKSCLTSPSTVGRQLLLSRYSCTKSINLTSYIHTSPTPGQKHNNLIMKFLNSILTLAAMASTTQACHCRTSRYGLAYYATATCCLRTGGTMSVFICPSGPLGNGIRLEAFKNCCREMLFTASCDD